MKLSLLALLAGAVAFGLACTTAAPDASAEGTASAARPFAIEARPATVASGKSADLSVVFKAKKGFHWNENFPASFKVTGEGDGKVAVGTKEFGKEAFKPKDKVNAEIKVPFDGRAAGQTTVSALASFSVCSEETCLIFRDEKVDIKVTVK